jgi:hypothetical protein
MTFARDQLLESADHVNALKRKNFLQAPVPRLSSSEAERSIGQQGGVPNEQSPRSSQSAVQSSLR